MKASEMTVEVKAKLEVPRNTAEGCLKMVELFLNNNPDVRIVAKRNEDGTERLEFADMKRG